MNDPLQTSPNDIAFDAALTDRDQALLTPAALSFLSALHAHFDTRRLDLLHARREQHAAIAGGAGLDFLPSTAALRSDDWRVAPPPADLVDRRVEITGPVDRKMIINALNSGASAFMADFEDSTSPTWRNVMDGQANLFDAVRRQIDFDDPRSGKRYALTDRPATLLVRPRGWHLPEKHCLVAGRRMSASLFDFGLFFFHNARAQVAAGAGPYFYLPKLECHQEARLWNDVFVFAQEYLGIPHGTTRAAVLIETITAVFEMHEILYALRDHSAGLNCGRWDYIFSFIKRQRPGGGVLPDRATVTMERPFLAAYSNLLIQTCHRRGAHAMGGMAAQIPIRRDEAANARAMARFHADKAREAGLGHDGSWVAHPGLVAPAFELYREVTDGINQLDKLREDVQVSAADLLAVPEGEISAVGVHGNLSVGIDYLAAWLQGRGCVPINNLMEDTATAEICRAQLWQWRRQACTTSDGDRVDDAMLDRYLQEVVGARRAQAGDEAFEASCYPLAAELFMQQVRAENPDEFLTIPAYEHI
jgi:malate synthase